MKPRTQNIVKGAGRELKGSLNKAAGRLTGKPGLRAKGSLQKAAGRAQRKVGEADTKMARQNKRQTRASAR